MDLNEDADLTFLKAMEGFSPPDFDHTDGHLPDLDDLAGHHATSAHPPPASATGDAQHSVATHGSSGTQEHNFLATGGHHLWDQMTFEEMMRHGGVEPSQSSSLASTSTATTEMVLPSAPFMLQGGAMGAHPGSGEFGAPSMAAFHAKPPEGGMPGYGLFPQSAAFRPRLRWTNELHNQFLESVEKLGGTNKATPSAILKHMAVDGLTLGHVKSHLQKYRSELKRAKEVRGKALDDMHQIKKVARTKPAAEVASTSSAEKGLDLLGETQVELQKQLATSASGPNAKELEEAMRTQLELQKMLCAQLEAQKELQRSLEQHTKYISVLMKRQSEGDLRTVDEVDGGAENEVSKA